jgi:transcription elongation factor Elf1
MGENIRTGDIYEYYAGQSSLMYFNWKTKSNRSKYVTVSSVLCMDCGHIELIGDLDIVLFGAPIQCPHCNAVYAYGKKEKSKGSVECQNCAKEFSVIKS